MRILVLSITPPAPSLGLRAVRIALCVLGLLPLLTIAPAPTGARGAAQPPARVTCDEAGDTYSASSTSTPSAMRYHANTRKSCVAT